MPGLHSTNHSLRLDEKMEYINPILVSCCVLKLLHLLALLAAARAAEDPLDLPPMVVPEGLLALLVEALHPELLLAMVLG